jgi:putative ABC transport system substrate-binding protein
MAGQDAGNPKQAFRVAQGAMTVRAAVVIFVIAVLTGPLAARADQPGKAFRIGLLGNLADPATASFYEAFFQGLRELGYVEGQNIAIERRSIDRTTREPWPTHEQWSALAADLVRLKVDVLVVPGALSHVAKQATRTIPIVLMTSYDPVGTGLVTSLARPEGNITGLSFLSAEIVGKQLQMLKDIAKGSRIAALWNPTGVSRPVLLEEAKAAARSLGVQLQTVEARMPAEFDGAFEAMTRERAGALLVFPNVLFYLHRTRIADLAMKSRLPAISGFREWADAGGLISYGANFNDLARRAATYVDKILKGAKPGDLPIEQPTRFELVINAKAARALGLTIPPSLLVRADRVIE